VIDARLRLQVGLLARRNIAAEKEAVCKWF